MYKERIEEMKLKMSELAEKRNSELEIYNEEEENFSIGFEYDNQAVIFVEINESYGPGIVGGFENINNPNEHRQHFLECDDAISDCDDICDYIDNNYK